MLREIVRAGAPQEVDSSVETDNGLGQESQGVATKEETCGDQQKEYPAREGWYLSATGWRYD